MTPPQKETKKNNLTIPKENLTSIERISKICKERDIELVFFKSPSADWTESYKTLVKVFMEENNYCFVDLNNYYKEIGIEWEKDFYDGAHLNKYGAKKTTDYLAKLIKPII